MSEKKWMTEKPGTIRTWFRWAMAAGFEWAQSGLDQTKAFNNSLLCHSMSDAISNFASWSTTAEGVAFWSKLLRDDIQWYPLDDEAQPPKNIIKWFNWAKLSGYEWAERAIVNAESSGSYNLAGATLSEAVNSMGTWFNTPEGENYWREIHTKAKDISWEPIKTIKKVHPKPRVIPIGCFTFDEFIDATVVNFLDRFTDKWDQQVTEMFLSMPAEKGFTDELRVKCAERALNSLNDAEFIAKQSWLYEHLTCIRRIRRAV